MVKKEYSHLVKPLLVRKPADGIFPEPCVWMEGKDLEGFNGHFSYGFIKDSNPFHPKEGAMVHPYDECLVFAGIDHTNILYLGAQVSIEVGEEREELVFDKPCAVLIPKGMPHGPIMVRRLGYRPIVHYTIGLAPEYKATLIPSRSLGQKSKGSKYEHLIKPFNLGLRQAKMNAEVMARIGHTGQPMRGSQQVGRLGPGNADQLVWLFGDNLEGMAVNFTWGYYSEAGIWHRGGEAHTHPEEEVLVFVGLDPDDINLLGAELELGMGKDYERHIFNKPTVAICPKGFPHLPLITRWVDKPYAFFVICLGGEHDSPWIEA